MGTTPSSPAASGGGLTDNVAGLLAYLFWPVAVVFLLIEPYNKNKFIRFHCFQCLFFGAACIVVSIVLMILNMILAQIFLPLVFIVGLLQLVIWLGVLVGWIVLMVKAFQNQMWRLPFIGDLAAKQAGV